jgi:DNA/RNA-binding protein KIN17
MVKIVNGRGRGQTGKLLELDLDKYTAKIKITSGEGRGTVLEAVEYEDLCKVRAAWVGNVQSVCM